MFTECSLHVPPGVGLTMWHGHRKNRGYSKRYDVLLENKFDPTEDIAVDNETEAWVWASNKTNLHSQMREYFSRRVSLQPRVRFHRRRVRRDVICEK